MPTTDHINSEWQEKKKLKAFIILPLRGSFVSNLIYSFQLSFVYINGFPHAVPTALDIGGGYFFS